MFVLDNGWGGMQGGGSNGMGGGNSGMGGPMGGNQGNQGNMSGGNKTSTQVTIPKEVRNIRN